MWDVYISCSVKFYSGHAFCCIRVTCRKGTNDSCGRFAVIRARHLGQQCMMTSLKWKHFPRHWPFVWGIQRSPVNSEHKGQWRGTLMFSLFCAWISGWANNREDSDLRSHRAHYDVTVRAPRYTLLPNRCHVIIYTNDNVLSIGLLRIIFSELEKFESYTKFLSLANAIS